MAGMLHASLPVNVLWPRRGRVSRQRCPVSAPDLLRSVTKQRPVKLARSLHSLSTNEASRFLSSRSWPKSPMHSVVLNVERYALRDELAMEPAASQPADRTAAAESKILTGLPVTSSCIDSVPNSFKAFVSSTSTQKGYATMQNWAISMARRSGRVLLLVLMFVMIDFSSGKSFSPRALAAPPATSMGSEKKSKGQENARSIKHFARDQRKNLSEKLDDITDAQENGEFVKKIIERISVADMKGVEANLKVLIQLEKDVGRKIDKAVDDYLSAELANLNPDATTDKKEALEAVSKEKAEILNQYQAIFSDIEMASKKISERMKQIDKERKAGPASGRPLTLSNISQDLERLEALKSERNSLSLAAKVGDVPVIPEFEGMAELMQEVEKEEILSEKLSDALQRLMANVLDTPNVDNAELEQSMQNARYLIDELRLGDGDVVNGAKKKVPAKELQKILTARDRVLSKTWYDEKSKRWEMNPSTALYVAENNLGSQARVRQDWAVMYLSLKGDDREYAVNLKEFQEEYEDAGGSQMLYLKLIASGVPSKVEVMEIPLREWEVGRLLEIPPRIIWRLLQSFWNSGFVVAVRPWYYKVSMGAVEEVMIRFGFPLVQRIVPQKFRVKLGFELAEGAEAAEPTDIIRWQQEAQKHVDARYAEGTGSLVWWVSLPVRCYLVGVPTLIVLQFALGILFIPFAAQELEMNDVVWKEKKQAELEKKLKIPNKKQELDPIKNVFDNMKRVKRPDVSLKDFAGIDMIREEINEIISFLKNPNLFKEMGARAPRGVLIVGESGTGKTTLALALAAEARVPMVELQGSELEGGAWVGQGASNVRELFKTAREMAPLIIFMDDFDHFAGVRGATSDSRKQDHESLINQLLVELDGFETQEGVVLVATTSRPHAIDEALRRPGRMDRTIKLPLPNKREREQILRQAAERTMDAHLIDYVDWSKVAEKTAGLTPSRLRYVPEGLEGSAVSFKIADEEELFFYHEILSAINRTTPKWILESKWTKWYNDLLLDWLGLRVSKENMDAAIETLDVFGESKTGIELFDPPYVWTREYKLPHAVWAAGKGLIALLLPDFDSVDLIWLDPTSWEGLAFTKFSKKVEGGYAETRTLTRAYCEKQLVSYFGSFVAMRMLLPLSENNSLSKSELDNAHATATRMVMEYGWAPDDSPMIYRADGSVGLAVGSEQEKDLVFKVNQLYFTAYQKAKHMLNQNRPVLEAMLERLLKFDVISNKDMMQILSEHEVIFEEGPFSLLPFTRNEIKEIATNGTGRSGKESPVSIS